MTLLEIYNGMKENLAKMEPRITELQGIIAEHRAEIEKHQKQIEAAQAELKKIQDIVEPLNFSKEALELTGIQEMEEEKNETEVKKEVDKKQTKKEEFSTWTRKNPKLVRCDRNGQELGRYSTQKAAARDLGWDQSSLSRFLKFDKSQQLAKKNFYFSWAH